MTTHLQRLAQTLSGQHEPGKPAAAGLLQRSCACGNHTIAGDECAECKAKKRTGVQAKLEVNESDDVYEQEAERVAEQLTMTPAVAPSRGSPPRVQRTAGRPTGRGAAAPASVDRALAGVGRPLESGLRQDMEARFGHDFAQVRVHTGPVAEQSAREVEAHAYTAGTDIVFGAGRFMPGTDAGRRLIAHELSHVVQQGGVPLSEASSSGRLLPEGAGAATAACNRHLPGANAGRPVHTHQYVGWQALGSDSGRLRIRQDIQAGGQLRFWGLQGRRTVEASARQA
jgi:hypothetical protein